MDNDSMFNTLIVSMSVLNNRIGDQFDTIKQLEAHIAEYKQHIAEQKAHIATLEARLTANPNSQDSHIAGLEAHIAQRDARIAQQDARIATLEAPLTAYRNSQDSEIAAVQAESLASMDPQDNDSEKSFDPDSLNLEEESEALPHSTLVEKECDNKIDKIVDILCGQMLALDTLTRTMLQVSAFQNQFSDDRQFDLSGEEIETIVDTRVNLLVKPVLEQIEEIRATQSEEKKMCEDANKSLLQQLTDGLKSLQDDCITKEALESLRKDTIAMEAHTDEKIDNHLTAFRAENKNELQLLMDATTTALDGQTETNYRLAELEQKSIGEVHSENEEQKDSMRKDITLQMTKILDIHMLNFSEEFKAEAQPFFAKMAVRLSAIETCLHNCYMDSSDSEDEVKDVNLTRAKAHIDARDAAANNKALLEAETDAKAVQEAADLKLVADAQATEAAPKAEDDAKAQAAQDAAEEKVRLTKATEVADRRADEAAYHAEAAQGAAKALLDARAAEAAAKALLDAEAAEAADLKAQEEATKLKTKQEADLKALKEATELKAKQEADLKALEEATELKAKQEADLKAQEEATELKAKQEADLKALKEATELKAKQEADLKAQADEAIAKALQEAGAQLEEAPDVLIETVETPMLSAFEQKQKLRQAALDNMRANY